MEAKVLDHEEASLLLPWLGTDRLEQPELELLLDHLKACPACRGELRDLSDLGRFAELGERAEAPGAAAIEARLGALLERLDLPARPRRHPGRVASLPPAAAIVGWRQVLPLAALVLLASGLLWQTAGNKPPAAPYRTLSNSAPVPASGAALRVVVAELCTAGELRGLLLAAGAEIRSGPSRRGVYTLALAAGAAAEAQIAAWRAEPCFTFVEKAAEGP